MYKIVEVSGFIISESIYCIIEKLEENTTGIIKYSLLIKSKYENDKYYIFDNEKQISLLHDIVGCTSSITVCNQTEEIWLVGKILLPSNGDNNIYSIHEYKDFPSNKNVAFIKETTKLSLYEIFDQSLYNELSNNPSFKILLKWIYLK